MAGRRQKIRAFAQVSERAHYHPENAGMNAGKKSRKQEQGTNDGRRPWAYS